MEITKLPKGCQYFVPSLRGTKQSSHENAEIILLTLSKCSIFFYPKLGFLIFLQMDRYTYLVTHR